MGIELEDIADAILEVAREKIEERSDAARDVFDAQAAH